MKVESWRKMKRIIKISISFIAMILYVILNNSIIIYSNIKENVNILKNVDVFTIEMIAGSLFIGTCIILLKKKGAFNKLSISMLLVTYGCSLLNGIFTGENIIMYVLIFNYILFITFLFSLYTKQRFEISLICSVSIMLLLIFAMSLFNLLFIIKYLILISIVVGLLLIFINIKKHGIENLKQMFKEKFCSCGLIIFSVLYMMCLFGGIGRYVHTYDEFSHWAFDAKSVIEFDELSTNEDVISRTRSYPPIISLWHYFINIFTGFNEHNLYIGLNMFVFIYIMPIFSFIKRKNLWITPFLFVTSISACFLLGGVYSYNSLYADLALSTVFTCNFLIYLLYKDDLKYLNKFLFLTLSILVLTKPTGIVMAGIFIFTMLLIDYLKFNEYNIKPLNFKQIISKLIKKWGKLIALILTIYLIWFGYVKIMNNITQDFYDFRLIPIGLESSLKYKFDFTLIGKICFNLLKSFDDPTVYGIIRLSFSNFIIIIFLLLFNVFYLKYKENYKIAVKKTLPYILSYIAFYLLTLLSVFVMFSVYEASILASFGRYLNTFNYALIIFIIAYISQEEFLINRKNKLFALLIYLLIIVNVPVTKMTYFVSDYENRIKTREFSYNMQDQFKIVNENTEEDSMVYILNQQDTESIMTMWYARYYLFPRKVNASSTAISWKIKTNKNTEDLGDWGLTAEELSRNLYDYEFDYLFLYSFDDEMFEKMKFMFNDYDKSKQHTLFKIIRKDNIIKLTPIA